MTKSPFDTKTAKEFIAICGSRNGYIQLACSQLIINFISMPEQIYTAASEWSSLLEASGAKRVYWFILSEQVKHLHIHLYPRWNDEESKGIALFEKRNNDVNQPAWTKELKNKLMSWSARRDVEIIWQPSKA